MSETDVQQANAENIRELHRADAEIGRLRAEVQRLLADRDAQVREAFMAAFQAGLMAVDKFGEQHTSADEAWAEFQARPSSGTGSGDKEQA